MRTFSGRITVVVLIIAAVVFTVVGLSIFRNIDPSALDVTTVQ